MTALGVYFAPTHGRQADRDYIAALQPPVIRLLDPDLQQLADMHALAPNAIIAPRTWAIDDNNGHAVRSLMVDPVGTGRDHAQQYRGQWDRWQGEAAQRGLRLPPVERILFNGANEPNQGGTPDKIAAYTMAFVNRCTELGIRAAALCLGVGWPDNTGPDTPVNWTPYGGIVEPIRRNGGCLELHEYNYKTGPQDGWRWLAGRHLQCPFDVPILLGEIGIDNYVDNERWRAEGGNRGWIGNVEPDAYAEMIERHIRGSDRRVFAALPFITDFRDGANWFSFDTGPAHNALLARRGRMVPQVTPIPQPPGTDSTVYIPVVGSGPSQPAPQEGNMDNWQRSRAFVKRWEGGFQDYDWDLGNWTGCEVGVGEKKGTKYGISACSYPHLDIRNITEAQADDIYRRDYWQASGADKLPWPACLIVFDTAILHGVGTARAWLAEVGPHPYHFAAKRLRVYPKLAAWPQAGAAWVARVADLLVEAAN